ncbi:MAG: hypothetical protein M1824_001852 [Vezdaea acicularis]|nr:MAG: hypothetical protein M1824_001852 [Vezdaea acicularis]
MGGFGGGVGGATGLTPSSSSAQAGTIHDCLSAAPLLRSLRLRFCGGTTYGTPDPSFALLLGSSTWPLLSSFSIESIMLRDADLLSFLKRHQSTLRSLSLHNIAFSSATPHHGPPPPPPPPPIHHGGAGAGSITHAGPGLCQAFLEELWHLQLSLESIDRFVISDEDGNSTGNSPGFDGAVVLQYLRGADPEGTGSFLDRPVGGDEVWDDEYI